MTVSEHENWFMLELDLGGTYTASTYTTSGASDREPYCQCRRHKRQTSIAGSGRSPGEGIGNPLQYSSLENPMGTGAWQVTVHSVTDTTEVT